MTDQQTRNWHREDIKAAVRKTDISLSALAVSKGLPEHACRAALTGRSVEGEKAIAERINVPVWELWPGRWRKPRRMGGEPTRIDNRFRKKSRRSTQSRHCLKHEGN